MPYFNFRIYFRVIQIKQHNILSDADAYFWPTEMQVLFVLFAHVGSGDPVRFFTSIPQYIHWIQLKHLLPITIYKIVTTKGNVLLYCQLTTAVGWPFLVFFQVSGNEHTGQARLIRSHSSTRFYFELSENLN